MGVEVRADYALVTTREYGNNKMGENDEYTIQSNYSDYADPGSKCISSGSNLD